MAKQVLDLYELFNLVVARGGLVEVINKKQWQEIIKGLGLPSSITSAAFTLRTQYTKYLYPYESHTKGLSSTDDLQNAIDGNRREGRRMEPGYPMTSQMSPMGPLGHHLPSSLHSPPRGHGGPMSPGAGAEQLQALEMTKLALWKLYNQGQPGAMPGLPPLMPNLPNLDLFGANQKEALNLHMAERAEKELAEKQKREEEKEEQRRREKQLQERLMAADQMREKDRELKERLAELDRDRDQDSPPPAKRQRDAETPVHTSLPRNSTNISMASRVEEDGRTSMEISLEINGITYSGVLFARPS